MKWSPKPPRSRCRRSRAIRTTGPNAGSTPGRHSPAPGRVETPVNLGGQAAGSSGTSAMESSTIRLIEARRPPRAGIPTPKSDQP